MNKFVHIMTIGVRPKKMQSFWRSHPKTWAAATTVLVAYETFELHRMSTGLSARNYYGQLLERIGHKLSPEAEAV